MIKKIVSFFLIFSTIIIFPVINTDAITSKYTLSDPYISSRYNTNLKNLTLTGDQRTDICLVALSQLGYHEGNSDSEMGGNNVNGNKNFVEYNRIYGKVDNGEGNGVSYGYSWCCAFATWCALQAGVAQNIIKTEISCSRLVNWFSSNSVFKSRQSNYVPKTGDLIFYKSSTSNISNHIGIVLYTDKSNVYTIEGNTGNIVNCKSYSLSDTYIYGYGVPDYTENKNTAIDISKLKNNYKITASSLNVRSGPGTSYGIVGTLNNGEIVTLEFVASSNNDWGKVTYGNNQSGYISLKYAYYYPIEPAEAVSSEIIKPWQKNVDGFYYGAKSDGTGAVKAEGVTTRCIDVSEHNGSIDWGKIYTQYKNGDIGFVLIRCGYGSDITSQDDKYWKRNADACTSYGIPFGVYLFSYADTLAKAKSEAQHALRLIKDYNLTYPVYYDVEWTQGQTGLGSDFFINICDIFCGTMLSNGYETGIYSMRSWMADNNYLGKVDYVNKHYSCWVAEYNSTLKYYEPYDIWQCTSKAKIDGNASQYCDVSFSYIPVRTTDHLYITFNVEESFIDTPAPIHKNKGEFYNDLPKLPDIDGRSFIGWSTDKNIVSLIDKDTIITTNGKQTLYAVYKDVYPELTGSNIYIDTDINIRFSAHIPSDTEESYLTVTDETGNTITIKEHTVVDPDTYLYVFKGLLPEMIGDRFTVTIHSVYKDKDFTNTVHDYSVKNYLLELTVENQTDTELLSLIDDLLIYGENCQIYRNYKTDDLICNGLTLDHSSDHIPCYSDLITTITNTDDTIIWNEVTLVLDSSMKINAYFISDDLPQDINITAEINGRKTEFTFSDIIKTDNDLYYISFDDIKAYEFCDTIIFSITDSYNKLTYSVDSYIFSMLDDHGDNDILNKLLLSIYHYGKSADAYMQKYN